MAMRISGLSHGPLADRHQLGERRRREPSQQEGAARQEQDQVRHRSGQSEQARAEFAALNRAIQETEDALAIAARAVEGLEHVEGYLSALRDRTAHLTFSDASPGGEAVPAWLAEGMAALGQVAGQTRFGSLSLLDGSLGCSGAALGDGLEFVGAGRLTRSSPPQGYEVLLTAEPQRATVLGGVPLTPARCAEGVQLVLREDKRTVRVTTRAGQSAADVAAALQAEVEREGLALQVEATRDGRLLVQHRCFGARFRFAVASSVPGVLSGPEGGPRRVENGDDIAGSIHGEPALGQGQTLTGCAGNLSTDGLMLRYTGLPFTGATQRLPRKRPAILETRVFAGRVVVAQQALSFRLDGEPGDTVSLPLASVNPEHLARGIATPSGFASLAAIQVGTPTQARDTLTLLGHALADVREQLEAIRALARGRLADTLNRLRVQAQNVAAASVDLVPPGAALQAVQALSQHILREARSALSAQAHPSRGSLLELLREENETSRKPRWN